MKPASSEVYDAAFFETMAASYRPSAGRVVPIVMDLIQPKSVIDVGCGVGGWLSVFASMGCEICGTDGDYVDRRALVIPQEKFIPRDLSAPFKLDRQFDLVCSLEVAEHLPPSRAESFVSDLCALGPAVLFSAAIPGQGGVHHVHEQWQDYWAELFARNGYAVFDPVRGEIWSDRNVLVHYRQNILLYVRESSLNQYPRLAALPAARRHHLRVVHPDFYLGLHSWFAPHNVTISRAARQLYASIRNAVLRRLGRPIPMEKRLED